MADSDDDLWFTNHKVETDLHLPTLSSCRLRDELDTRPLVCHQGGVNVTIKISKTACVCYADRNSSPSRQIDAKNTPIFYCHSFNTAMRILTLFLRHYHCIWTPYSQIYCCKLSQDVCYLRCRKWGEIVLYVCWVSVARFVSYLHLFVGNTEMSRFMTCVIEWRVWWARLALTSLGRWYSYDVIWIPKALHWNLKL